MTIQYLQLLRDIKEHGVFKGDRTGTGTQSLFGAQSRYDLRQGFPLLTTKKMFVRGIFEELLWFLRGSTDANELIEKDVHIWDGWMKEDGTIGAAGYGAQWRHWNTHNEEPNSKGVMQRVGGRDQIAELITRIKEKPDDRRLIVTAWNPDDLNDQKLPPCHCFFQCWTRELTAAERMEIPSAADTEYNHSVADAEERPVRGLSLHLYQRSCDVFLGVPFNIASYALLTHMIAQVCGMAALDFVHTYGDVHIYNNHREQVDLQLSRKPKPLPMLWLNPEITDIDLFTIDDIRVEGYEHDARIKGEVSI